MNSASFKGIILMSTLSIPFGGILYDGDHVGGRRLGVDQENQVVLPQGIL